MPRPATGSNTATGELTGTINATSPSNTTLTYAVTTGPTRGGVTVDPDGSWTYQPNQQGRLDTWTAAQNGQQLTDTFTITVAAAGATTTTPVTVHITLVTPDAAPAVPANPASTITGQNTGTGEVNGALHITNPSNSALTYTIADGPDHAHVRSDGPQ